jgi:hypothetical protein
MEGRERYPTKPAQDRWVGLFLFLLGLVAVYFFVVSPLVKAYNHQQYITTFKEGVALAPVCVIIGLYFLILGPRARSLLDNRPYATLISVVVIIFLLLIGLLFVILQDAMLSRLGYGDIF